jgi:hypothetical protein
MLKTILALIILLFLFQSAACAEYYKWEDENGTINITDYPPPEKSKKTVKVYQAEQESIENVPSSKDPAQLQPKASSQTRDIKQRKSNDVVLYTTSWCPYCKKAKEFFKSRNIYFTNYDIEQDRDAAVRKKQLDLEAACLLQSLMANRYTAFRPAIMKGHCSKLGDLLCGCYAIDSSLIKSMILENIKRRK